MGGGTRDGAVADVRAATPRRLVGIGGQFDSGKDTLADHLAGLLNDAALAGITASTTPPPWPWQRTAFADAVKQVFCDTFGVTRAWVEHWKRVPEPPPGFLKSVRQCLIDIGEGFRTFQHDVWIRRALDGAGQVVVSDVRYLDELAEVKRRGGITILLWRPGHENETPSASEQQLRGHIRRFAAAGVRGPTGDPLVDLFVVNDGSKDDLYRQAQTIVLPYLRRHLDDAPTAV